MPINFITYGNARFTNSRLRICMEAEQTGVFNSCTIYTPESLALYLTPEIKKSIEPLFNQHRGGGYWWWKPVIVLQTMEKIPENDWILYADSGCSFLQDRKEQIIDLISSLEKSGKSILGYQMGHLEEHWTKADLFHFFNVQNNKEITSTGQIISGIFFVKNTPTTRSIYKEMVSIMENYPNLIDDSPSKIENDKSFREHRHDQSLLSVILKMNKEITMFVADGTYHGSSFIQATRIWG